MLQNKKEQFLQNSILKLQYFNYSENTIKIYSHYILKFLNSIKSSPSKLSGKDFQNYLDNYNFSSVAEQNQVISAIKFFFEKVLGKKYIKVDFKRPRKEKRLPKVIDKCHLKSKILSVQNKKHKAILSLGFSCGLRVSEILNLKIKDIDSKRGLIHIVQAKGKKDRVVPLSETLLKILRSYYKEYRPKIYLFNGQNGGKYSSTSCNNIIKKHISADAHMHVLRHSCFTSLLESGVNLRTIQSIAGHKNVKTTEVYTHVSNNVLQKTPMPI